MKFSKILIWITVFLFITTFTGLFFRMQMAGVSIGEIANLDLRRAHSHLGYYGVLFPMAWISLFATTWWTPQGRGFVFYSLIVLASFFGFLWEGYGLLSIVTSTIVLAIWIYFVWKNRIFLNFTRGTWIHSIPVSILLSACLIPLVAVFSSRDSTLARNLAETFLALLMFGVFIPAILSRALHSPPQALEWTLAVVLMSVDVSGLVTHWVFHLGTMYLGFLLLQTILKEFRTKKILSTRLLIYWAVFSVSLILLGVQILPQSHLTAIAGIHFLILGPLLLSFVALHVQKHFSSLLQIGYEASLLIMVAAIVFPMYRPEMYIHSQKIAMWSGASVIVFLVIFLVNTSVQSGFPQKRN